MTDQTGGGKIRRADKAVRRIVTEDAFRVRPELLGLRLAGPWRRLSAAAVDGTAIALLASLPVTVIAIAVAAILFRVSGRHGRSGALRTLMLWGGRFALALIVFLVARSALGLVQGASEEWRRDDDRRSGRRSAHRRARAAVRGSGPGDRYIG